MKFRIPGLNVPSTAEGEQRAFYESLKERLELLGGERGDPEQRSVSLRELREVGLAGTRTVNQRTVLVEAAAPSTGTGDTSTVEEIDFSLYPALPLPDAGALTLLAQGTTVNDRYTLAVHDFLALFGRLDQESVPQYPWSWEAEDYGFDVANVAPRFRLNELSEDSDTEPSRPADENLWDMQVDASVLSIRARNDDDDGGTAAIQLRRTADTITSVDLPLDNEELRIGVGHDLRLFHDGTNSTVRNDTGHLKLLAGATEVARVASTNQLALLLGSNSAPALTFIGDENTGIYSGGADQINFTTGGTNRLSLTTGSFSSNVAIRVGSGTAAIPTYSFGSSTNLGLYRVAADTLGLSTAGVLRYQFGPTGELGMGGATYGTSGDVLKSGGTGAAPTWATPGALTKTDDTNVTLTLGGTPATALVNAASLTLGWTGQLSVARGGSGAATLTGYLVGNGTSPFTAVSTIPYADLTGVAAASHTHAAADITSGTFADARIAASNVTQHEAALTIDWSQLTSVPSFGSSLSFITKDNETATAANSRQLVAGANVGIDYSTPGQVIISSSAAGGGGGTVTSVNLTAPAAGITVSGGPITVSGSITLALADDLAALEALSSTGLAARTAANTWAQRTITGTSSRISITNGNGVSGNPTVDIDAAYVGQATITTLGTVTTGTWSATAVAANKGGTGQTSYAVGDLLYASTTSALSKLADVATGNALISGGVGVAPAWGKIALTTHVSGTLPVANGGTGVTALGALTKSDDTNVTLTLGGSPTTALVNAASITVGWTGTLAVARGGLGVGTVTGLLQGNGTSAVTAITDSSTVGQVLRVTGANTYAWGALDLSDADAITGDLPDANLSANVPLLNAANSFSAQNDFTNIGTSSASSIRMTSTTPLIEWVETDGVADNQRWRAFASAEQFKFDVSNDASTVRVNWLTVDRTGTTIDTIALAATTVTVNGQDVRNTALFTAGTLGVARGGTGAATITGLLQGNGTSAVTAITNSTTVGQVLRVTGANTYAWGALDLSDSDAITGDLPDANLSANVPLLNAANTFTSASPQTIQSSGATPFVIERTGATTSNTNIKFLNTANTRYFGIDASGNFKVGSASDLNASGTAISLAGHTHDAADIVSGTIATARLGSGTANSTTFLRGDGTWATPAGSSLADGDKGDITVSGSGATWTIDTNIAKTWTGAHVFDSTLTVVKNTAGYAALDLTGGASSGAILKWTAPSGAADEKKARIYIGATGSIFHSFVNDAESSEGVYMQVTRSGASATNITLNATEITSGAQHEFVGSRGAANQYSILLSAAQPAIGFIESGVTADNGRWLLRADAEGFYGTALSDTEASFTNWIGVSRTGTTIDDIDFTATDASFSGNLSITGSTTSPAFNCTHASGPVTRWNQTGAAADAKIWEFIAATTLRLRARDDTNTTGTGVFQVHRSGATVSDITIETKILGVDGSTSGPTYGFASDTNTGMYWGGADTIKLVTGGSDRVVVDSAGRLYGLSLHNNASSPTGTTNGYIASGTYTPTLTGSLNVASTTSAVCQWLRVGNVVTVSGVINIDPTAAGTTTWTISLPIASNFTNVSQLGGVGAADASGSNAVKIEGSVAGDNAACLWVSPTINITPISFHFTYVVV